MTGHEFNGDAVSLPSPAGGTVIFALGELVAVEGGTPEPCAYLKLIDREGEVIADFGMTPGTFATVMEAMMIMMDRTGISNL